MKTEPPPATSHPWVRGLPSRGTKNTRWCGVFFKNGASPFLSSPRKFAPFPPFPLLFSYPFFFDEVPTGTPHWGAGGGSLIVACIVLDLLAPNGTVCMPVLKGGHVILGK